jgi:putative spermidine/putrescine transport system substrate-binding protein
MEQAVRTSLVFAKDSLPSRREVVVGLGAAGLAAPAIFGPRDARAAGSQIVMANWGGDAQRAFAATFVPHYETLTGGKMILDGTGPSNGKIRAMVESGNVTWDVCDAGAAAIGELGIKLGLLEPIDYSVVDRSKTIPEFVFDYGVGNYFFSYVMAWNTEAIKTRPSPSDFFDVGKLPGRRMVRKDPQPMLELALMADGVAPDKLYPLDRERALAKLASIKPHLLFWETGSQGQDILRSGEAVMGWLWHTRANVLKKQTGGRIDWAFPGGVLVAGAWVVPKGNPAGNKAAMAAIRSMQDPEPQVKLLAELGMGPSNPLAQQSVPPELRAINPTAPENAAVQAKMSFDWWMKNYADTQRRYVDMIAS